MARVGGGSTPHKPNPAPSKHTLNSFVGADLQIPSLPSTGIANEHNIHTKIRIMTVLCVGVWCLIALADVAASIPNRIQPAAAGRQKYQSSVCKFVEAAATVLNTDVENDEPFFAIRHFHMHHISLHHCKDICPAKLCEHYDNISKN